MFKKKIATSAASRALSALSKSEAILKRSGSAVGARNNNNMAASSCAARPSINGAKRSLISAPPAERDPFVELLEAYRGSTSSLSDLDDIITEAVRYDDAVGFNELARRWDRLQFGSKAILIADSNFDDAVRRTEEAITHYFETSYATLGAEAPSLTLHRPAFQAPFDGTSWTGTTKNEDDEVDAASSPTTLLLRARPSVLRYRPRENQWVVMESQASVDPLATSAKAALCLQRLHFSMLCFRYWITQEHIPIAIRKRFLAIDLNTTTTNARSAELEGSTHVAAPIDLKRSGILHIRQYFPGPATIVDCDPPRLVKFIQRLSLEEMLASERKTLTKQGGAFDLHHLGPSISPIVAATHKEMLDKMAKPTKQQPARSTRSLRQKDQSEHELFELQQRLMEALLRHHTLELVRRGRSDEVAVEHWSSFASSTSGTCHGCRDVSASTNHTQKGKSKKPASRVAAEAGEVPAYSAFLGPHCSRGDACPFLVEGKCLPNRVEAPMEERNNHLFTLPSTSVGKKVSMWSDGMRGVRDVLHSNAEGRLKLTAPQLRYATAVAQGHLAIHPHEIDLFFSKLRYPLFVLDFEATQFALPPFPKVVAYQSIPFQFSLDVFHHDVLHETPTHYDFLHFGKGYSPNMDPRPGCVEELMRIVQRERAKKKKEMEASGELARIEEEAEALRNAAEEAKTSSKRRGRSAKTSTRSSNGDASRQDGPAQPYDGCFLAHYASFEKSCLEKLGQLVEKHKAEIQRFHFLDTMDLLRKGLIHPNAQGSNSLKKVLPAFCPDVQYGIFGCEGGHSEGGGEDHAADAQKGENAMGIFRLWHHHEGGCTMEDVQRMGSSTQWRAPQTTSTRKMEKAVQELTTSRNSRLTPEERDRLWAILRIQLLEYCSLDTKALYEILREVSHTRELARDEPTDKSGWIFMPPSTREVEM